MNQKYARYAAEWEDLDEDMKLTLLEAVGLDPVAYGDDKFETFPKWAQDKLIALDQLP